MPSTVGTLIVGSVLIVWASHDGHQRTHVRFGSKADICGAINHVRFTPNGDRESGFLH